MASMETRFAEWLVGELADRGWSQRELARRSDVSHTTVSDVLANVRRPTWDFCASVAGAMGEDPDRLFALAGLKEQPPAPVTEEAEAVSLLRALEVPLRGAAVAMLRGLVGERQAAGQGKEAEAARGDLERDLLEAFRQLSPRWQQVFLEDVRRASQMGLVRFIGEGEEPADDEQPADAT